MLALVAMPCAWLDASCCSSAATGGVGRLLRHERALVELSTNGKLTLGAFNNQARFNPGHTPKSPYLVFEPELAVVTRVLTILEPFAKLPVRIQKSDVRAGAHLADITLGVRAPIIREDLLPGLPALTMIGSVRIPTGASSKHDPNLFVEHTTGTGNYLLGLSVVLEKEIKNINLSAGYGLAVESDYFTNQDYSPGFIHSPLVAIAFMPHDGGLLSLTWSMMMQGQPKLEKRPLVDADSRKMTLAVAYSIGIHSHIKLNAQLGSDVPIDYLGKNFNSEAFIRLGLRFGVF